MRALDLTHGFQALIDEADAPRVAGYNWYVTRQGYAGATYKENDIRKMVLIHRLLTAAPAGTHVDHINGDKLDNRSANLRVVSFSINQVNRKRLNKNNTSGMRGVRWCQRKNKWLAQITVNRANKFIGYFTDADAAVAARKAAEARFWGELSPC